MDRQKAAGREADRSAEDLCRARQVGCKRRVPAWCDRAQRGPDGGHFSIDEVECRDVG